MRPLLNAFNFVGAARVIQEGIAVDPLLVECELKARDLYQTKFDILKFIALVWAKRHDFHQAQLDNPKQAQSVCIKSQTQKSRV
jgi:hypothetical protein